MKNMITNIIWVLCWISTEGSASDTPNIIWVLNLENRCKISVAGGFAECGTLDSVINQIPEIKRSIGKEDRLFLVTDCEERMLKKIQIGKAAIVGGFKRYLTFRVSAEKTKGTKTIEVYDVNLTKINSVPKKYLSWDFDKPFLSSAELKALALNLVELSK